MVNALKLTLIENAEDFLREAVKHAKVSSPRDWKYATLHLWSALELLLKGLLESEHWSLLFEDINRASKKKLREGDFQTVRFETALERIRGIVGISIGDKDLRYLRQLRDLRNRMTHYAVALNVEQAKSVVARGISVFLTLEQRYLHEQPDKALEYEIPVAPRKPSSPEKGARPASSAGRNRRSRTLRTTIAKGAPVPVPNVTTGFSRSFCSTMKKADSCALSVASRPTKASILHVTAAERSIGTKPARLCVTTAGRRLWRKTRCTMTRQITQQFRLTVKLALLASRPLTASVRCRRKRSST
jgi:hypothetical protein